MAANDNEMMGQPLGQQVHDISCIATRTIRLRLAVMRADAETVEVPSKLPFGCVVGLLPPLPYERRSAWI